MTIGFYDSSSSAWLKFMKFQVMAHEQDEFISANVPANAKVYVIPDSHDVIFHPTDWSLAGDVLTGQDGSSVTLETWDV